MSNSECKETTMMQDDRTIDIADDSYDCHATDTNWRYGLYLDPEARRVSHWQFYGSGTPGRVCNSRARIAILPLGAVGEQVEAIVRGDEFRTLVEALFALYRGTEWDGSIHVGRWAGVTEYESQADELEQAIERLFEAVSTYWSAGEWMSQVWGQNEADSVRARMQQGETLDAIAEEMVGDALSNGVHIHAGEMQKTLQDLLEQHPVECGCSDCDCDEPATTSDDGGNAVCDACSVHMALDSGEIVCSQQTCGFTQCHECGETIEWGGILTGQPGASNYRLGDCGCGKNSWQNRENGGSWDWYGYAATSKE